MSSGSFVNTKYQANNNAIHQVKLQPETVSATIGGTANAAPAGAIDSMFAAEVNRGARGYGLKPRRVNVAFEDSPPSGYRPYTTLSIVILTKDLFEAISDDDPVAYNGGTGKVSSKVGENIRPGAAVLGSTPPQIS